MNATIARERPLTDDSRITNLEVNVQHLQSDVTDIKGMLERLREAFESFKIEVTKEFGAIRTEIARGFGTFRGEVSQEIGSFRTQVAQESGTFRAEVSQEIGSFRTQVAQESGTFRAEVAQEMGSLRTSIERAKLWMVVTGLGTILSVWGAAFALARYLKP